MEMAAAKTLLRAAQITPLKTVTQQAVRLSIVQPTVRFPYCSLQTTRHFSTTPCVGSQSAAARKPEEAEDTPPPQPKEPEQRVTIAARHQREARTSTSKRRDPLGFMANARNASDAVASPKASSTSSSSPLIPVNRNPSDAFLLENANNPAFDFLKKSRASTPQQQNSKRSSDTGAFLNSFNSMSALLQAVTDTPAAGIPKPRPSKIDIDKMLMPGQPSRPEAYNPSFPDVALRVKVSDTAPPTFRISPSLGRTVAVDTSKNVDVARAFRLVELKCNMNSVKQDLYKQRFHERPGIRRKRLVMSRWRTRFKEAFKATVKRVEDMRRKGW